VLPLRALPSVLAGTPFEDAQGLGAKLGDALDELVGMKKATFSYVTSHFTLPQLQAHFGPETGTWINRICHGITDI
jgi:nucleotidyltransferase/DNA polymerase involved in DNA repair